jgi:two-component system sensor histidine kinase KdpD
MRHYGRATGADTNTDEAATTTDADKGARTMPRGKLRIYLGAAPGVGKTYAMLGEGRRRQERGADVVVAFVEDHGRALTAAMTDGLEIVPRRTLDYRGATFTELDLDAVLARRPRIALVDELAHSNVPGSRHEKRWQDVEELLEAGIDVISTVNIQHLDSLNDVVAKITGVTQHETVPDAVVRAADQVELVDMSAEALRRRMAHGNIYAPEKVDAALSHYFRVGNLTALRELALLWLADKVDDSLQQYRTDHGIGGTWETRERVVVALTGGAEGETLIRRGARIAARSAGGDLLAVQVAGSDGLAGASPKALVDQRSLVESLGGTFHQVVADDVPTALLDFARAENATQLVLGASRRSAWSSLFGGRGIGASVIRDSGDIDVHIVTHGAVGRGVGLPPLGGGLTARRRWLGVALAMVLMAGLTAVLTQMRGELNLVSAALLFQLAVVVVALVGGLWAALAAALVGSALLNFYFVPPLYTFNIGEPNNALALLVFLAVAGLVSAVVDTAARRTRQAARSEAESATLATIAGSILRGQSAVPALLDRVREAFSLDAVTLLERDSNRSWTVIDSAGDDPARRPEDGDGVVPIDESLTLVLRGRTLQAKDRRVLGAFAAYTALALEQERLAKAAAEAGPLAEVDRLRTAILAAVGHDLRTPLASAKAAVTSLRGDDVEWTANERSELLATADESLDSLARLVDNLLDVSRLQAGVLPMTSAAVGLDEVVAMALDGLDLSAGSVTVDVPSHLPAVQADPVLLERAVANLVSNAVSYSASAAAPPTVTASVLGDVAELRIVDRGPGVPEQDRATMFAPFQRLGDTDNTTGLGLGLALTRGLIESMGGTLTPEDTPGGGLTMVVSIPLAPPPRSDAPVPGRRERDERGTA